MSELTEVFITIKAVKAVVNARILGTIVGVAISEFGKSKMVFGSRPTENANVFEYIKKLMNGLISMRFQHD